MSSKRHFPPIFYIGLAILFAIAGNFVYKNYISKPAREGLTDSQSSPANPAPISSGTSTVNSSISQGEKLLFTDNLTPDKLAAATALASGDFTSAIAKLETSLQQQKNDPEALIYLNNARLGQTASLTVAVVVPIGNNPNAARELLRGVAQAQDEAIKTGVPLKVVIADDGNDETRAKEIANTLVQDQNIIAVVGHGTSKTSLAAAPIYSENQLPMIAPTSTTTEFAQIPKGANGTNYIFRTIASDQFTGTILARYLLTQMNQRRVAIFYNPKSSYSKSLQNAFSTTLSLEGGQVVKEVDLSQPNPAAQLTDLQADALALFPDSDTLTPAIQVAQSNQNRLPLIAGDAMYNINSLKLGGAALEGMVVSVPWHPLASPNPSFTQAASNLWGGDINWRTALSYDAVQAILNGRSLGNITPQSGQQGRIAMAQALANSNFQANGATGEIRFLPSGDRNSSVILLKVEPGKRSGTGYDFVPIQ